MSTAKTTLPLAPDGCKEKNDAEARSIELIRRFACCNTVRYWMAKPTWLMDCD